MDDLRTRTKALMRNEVRATALRLFDEQGYDATTTAQIADAAGISASSFFRYFVTKEDVVFDEPTDYAERLRTTLQRRPADESVWDALRETMRLRTAAWVRDPEQSRLVLRLWAHSAALQAHQRAVADTWRSALIEETTRRLGRRDRNARLRAAATVGAVFAALDAALTEWQLRSPSSALRAGPPNSLDDLFDAALGAVVGGA